MCARIYKHEKANTTYIAELCSGSTADSDSVCLGSNPSSAAKNKKHSTRSAFCFCLQNRGFEHSVLPSSAKRGFAYLARRSTSSLVRRRAWVSSPQANTLVPLQKNPTRKSWIFSFVPQGTTSFAWHTQHHLTVRSTSLPPRVAQINEVEALPQIMLQQVANDVMLRINDVALHANGYAFISKNRLAVRRCRNDKEQKNDINICFTRDWTEVSFKAIRF